MLFNGIAHDEDAKTGYTAAGDAAGNNGNVAVSERPVADGCSFVELWMTGPFHASGCCGRHLQRSGYGQCANPSTSPWHSVPRWTCCAASAPRSRSARQSCSQRHDDQPRSTSSSRRPDPLAFCGWTGAAGLPVIVQMPEGFSTNPTASMSGPGGPIETCVLSQRNTSGVAQSILGGNNAVVVIPRTVLAPGHHVRSP